MVVCPSCRRDNEELEVVAVNHAFGWTVELADTQAFYAEHVPDFRQMLSAWHYR